MYVGRDGDDLMLNSTSAGRILFNGIDLTDIAGCGAIDVCQRWRVRRAGEHVDAGAIRTLGMEIKQLQEERERDRALMTRMLAMIFDRGAARS